MAVNSQQPSFPFMIQELTVDEEEPPDSSFQCLKFLPELFVLPVSAEGEKKISGLFIVVQVFQQIQKNLRIFL